MKFETRQTEVVNLDPADKVLAELAATIAAGVLVENSHAINDPNDRARLAYASAELARAIVQEVTR